MIFKTLKDIERIINKKVDDNVLNKFIQSYLEGLYYTPLLKIQEEYEELISKEYAPVDPPVCPQIWDMEIEAMIDDPNWIPPKTELEIDKERISALVNEYPWLIEPIVPDTIINEYQSLIATISSYHPVYDENGTQTNESDYPLSEIARKQEIEVEYPYINGWVRKPPTPNIDIWPWRKENYAMLREPYYASVKERIEADYDARVKNDTTKRDDLDSNDMSVKERFFK